MKSLKSRIYKYMCRKGGWIHSGVIERLAMDAGYKASNSGRRLRELCEAGSIERMLNEKGHVLYRAEKPKMIYEYKTDNEGYTSVQIRR